jgi:cellulose synthase/poly-beta-1,6-N-acetylglucosamine synthase-like glycosyltransferase
MWQSLELILLVLQIVIGFHLFFPLGILIFSKIYVKNEENIFLRGDKELDFALIVTAYEETFNLPQVVHSILKQEYQNFIIYIVADKCDVSNLHFDDERVILLKPEKVIGSNTGSHAYAVKNFNRQHDIITIIDSDNIVHPNYLKALTIKFNLGYKVVQGVRQAKNLNSTYACLDAARDVYYHFYDGKVLSKAGSSATLAGSGMAFNSSLYQLFLKNNKVSGAGFDKVLQYWLLKQNIVIAFTADAIVYDEKTAQSDQLVKQRSRWINTWFKYFKYGFYLIYYGIKNGSINQFLFGLVLLRPPLFIFLLLSLFCFGLNLYFNENYLIWIFGFVSFISSFFIALLNSKTDKRIYLSLINIPKFIFFQILSLTKIRKANSISVATKHSVDINTSTK